MLVFRSLAILALLFFSSCDDDDSNNDPNPEPVNSSQTPEGGTTPTGETNTLPQNSDPLPTSGNRILMFVAYNQVWWAEYKILYESLIAEGYEVDVVSSDTGHATSYQSDTDIEFSADSVSDSSFADFSAAFNSETSGSWDASWNTPQDIPLAGRIQDVENLGNYLALVAAGGTGALQYLYDGSYAQSEATGGGNLSSSSNVQAASEKFAALVAEALASGKPVLTQCHGAKLSAYARSPGTVGQGFDGLGKSILEGGAATGFHLDSDAADSYTDLGVTYHINRRVVVSSVSPSLLSGSETGISKVITSRDWYPQTVLAASKTLLNILETFPSHSQLNSAISVLLIHGGPVDTGNCSAGNKTTNDVPCNFGANFPADYTDFEALLVADSSSDPFSITVTEANIMPATGSPPFDVNIAANMESYFQNYDVIIYYKHWNTGMTTALETELVNFADNGGGLIAIHHGLYNDGGSKDIIAAAFNAESSSSGWGNTNPYSSGTYGLMNVNQGHFVSTYALSYNSSPIARPGAFPSSPSEPNFRPWGYPGVDLLDEIYTNTTFINSPVFGSGVNEVNLLFANDYTASAGQTKTAGFTKIYNGNEDSQSGRLVFLQPGEVQANYGISSFYGQVLRNAVIWAGQDN